MKTPVCAGVSAFQPAIDTSFDSPNPTPFGEPIIHPVSKIDALGGVEMGVSLGRRNRCVAELLLKKEHVRPFFDHQTGRGVPQVMNASVL
jgi:hypothetical protein